MRQEDLAVLVGIGTEELGRYERGERKPPMQMLFMLSAALKVPSQALYPELWKKCQRKVEECFHKDMFDIFEFGGSSSLF